MPTTINGTPAGETLTGTSADEQINGLGGNDSLIGNGGNDTIDGGVGNDTLDGGPETGSATSGDFASYATAPAGVIVSLLIGQASDDGNSGIDTLVAIEHLIGSAFPDKLTGDNLANSLIGSAGNDTLFGLDGNDTLRGGAGFDTLDGGNNGTTGDWVAFDDSGGTQGADIDLSAGTAIDEFGHGGNTLTGIENVYGSAFNDTLRGDNGANFLSGIGGNDELEGGPGNDTFSGGTGNDTIDGQTGLSDIATYANSTAAINAKLYNNTVNDGFGNTDTISNVENIEGSIYNDTIAGDGVDNALFGGQGNDDINGTKGGDLGSGNDSLYGQEGNDTLTGSDGNDLIDGGDGDDTVVYDDTSTGNVTVNLTTGTADDGSSGTDTIVAVEHVRMLSPNGNDKLTGNSLANKLEGGQGDDTLFGAAGNDTLLGGPDTGPTGGDWADYYGDTAAVNVNLAGLTATDGYGGIDTFSGIEHIAGTGHNDTVAGDANDNKLLGWEGEDTIYGLAGNDSIDGGAGTDSIEGGAGNDSLDGGVAGTGSGFDLVTYRNSPSGVSVSLLSNKTLVDGWGGLDDLVGFEGIWGSDFNDTLDGGAGNDILADFDGNDSMTGGGGADLFYPMKGNDTVVGDGLDALYFHNSPSGVTVNLALGTVGDDGWGTSDVLTGSFAQVHATAYNDSVVGSAAVESLFGLDGDDTLDGGSGNDVLDGGVGSLDVVSYENASEGVVLDLSTGTASNDGYGTADTVFNFEAVEGSAFADKITGSGVGELFDTGDGDDTIIGGGGDDTLCGEQGNDSLDGGAGSADWADYRDDTAGVAVNLAGSTATDGWGTIDTLANLENIAGSDFNDSLTGDDFANKIDGRSGNDTLLGGLGNDTLVGGSGTNELDGGSGIDTAHYLDEVFYTINLTTGTATGAGINDTLKNIENAEGGFLADKITGSSANNVLDGNQGDDTIEGGAGDDTIDGGEGVDTVVYSGDISNYIVNSSGPGNYTVQVKFGGAEADRRFAADGHVLPLAANPGDIDTLFNVENLLFNGKAFNDGVAPVFVGGVPGEGTVGVAPEADIELQFDESVQLGAGSIVIKDGLGAVVASYTKASSELTVSANKLTINPAANLAYGTTYVVEFGLDSVQDFGGNKFAGAALTFKTLEGTAIEIVDKKTGNLPDQETIFGSPGSDTVVLAGAQSGVIVDLGKGEASGPGGTVTLVSIEGAVGSDFDDQLIGNDGDNFFDGQDGNDIIEGGPGSDTASYEDAPGGVNVDLTKGSATGDGNDTLISIENVDGSGNNDTITGSNVDNILDGGPGADQMKGGLGNDTYYVDNPGDQPIEENNNTLGAVLRFAQQIQDLREALLNDDRRLPVVDIGANVDKVIASIDHTLGAFIENLDLAGGGDTKGTGNELANAVNGNGGNNGLNGGGGNDTIDGGSGNDSINGGSGNDVLVGGEGNDTLSGGGGNDSVIYNRSQSSYTVTQNPDGSFTVKDNTGADGTDTILAGATLLFGGVPFAPPATEAPAPPAPPPGTTSQPNTVTGADASGNIGSGINLTGGSGYDVVVFNTAKGPITIDLSRKSFSGGGGGGRIEGVEGIIGSLFGDTMLGDDGPNLFDGGFGADIFFGGAGDDTLAGGDGLDLAIYLGSSSKYTVTADGKGGLTISGGADGRDTLTGVERISFGDKSLAFDLSPEGSAGKTALLAGALLGKGSLANAPLMGTLVSYFDGGKSLSDASNLLITSGIVSQLAGGNSNEALVSFLFTNLIGAPPDAATTAQLAGLITSGQFTQASFLSAALQLDLTQSVVGLTGLGSTGLAFVV